MEASQLHWKDLPTLKRLGLLPPDAYQRWRKEAGHDPVFDAEHALFDEKYRQGGRFVCFIIMIASIAGYVSSNFIGSGGVSGFVSDLSIVGLCIFGFIYIALLFKWPSDIEAEKRATEFVKRLGSLQFSN